MRRLALPLALVVGMLASGAASAASTTAFTGEWIGNDPPVTEGGDGSVVHLYVTGGTHAKVTFTDEFGSVCVNARLDGSVLHVDHHRDIVYDDIFEGTFRAARCGTVPLPFLTGADAFF